MNKRDAVERVKMMVEDLSSNTWDLSLNDKEAIRIVFTGYIAGTRLRTACNDLSHRGDVVRECKAYDAAVKP